MSEKPEFKENGSSCNDAEVIKKVLDGSVDEFELLINRYRSKVGIIVASRVKPEDVGALMQQVFVRAFKALGSFTGKAPFENWISKLAVHCCHDYWRRNLREIAKFAKPGRNEDYQKWLEKVSAVPGEESVQELAESEDTRMMLEKAMACLEPDERWLMEAHYYEDMPLKEAAATLGWSLVKTKVKAMRTRYKLRKAIDEITGGYLR